MKADEPGASPAANGVREPGSWAESLTYIAIILVALGCLGFYASSVTACDAAGGNWQDATIVQIDHQAGLCSYAWAWGSGSAPCPPTPDLGEPVEVYVTIDTSSGSNLVTLEPSSPWRGSAPFLAASAMLCLLGLAAWVAAGRIEARHGSAQP